MAFIIRPDRKETENKTIRFPVDLIENIEDVCALSSVSFSGFVIQACEYALNDYETPADFPKAKKTNKGA